MRDVPEMPEFDVEAFVARLDGLGMKLSAVPLADGRLRVSRWCMTTAYDHARDIEALWQGHIGDDQGRMDVLAAHLATRKVSRGTDRAGSASAG